MMKEEGQEQKTHLKLTEKKKRRDFGRDGDEWEQKVVDLARVTRVTEGGKRMRFRAGVLVGNKKGQIGFGVSKGNDVSLAVNKALVRARKNIISVPMVGEGTIPHRIVEKYAAAKVMLKPAPKGSGIIAGGVVRSVLELSGLENVVSKMMGSKNKINNTRAAINALEKLSLTKVREKKQGLTRK